MRDEGVYKTPIDKKKKIFTAYSWLTEQISKDLSNKKLINYNSKSLQGKLHKKKDLLSWEMVKKTYLEPKFLSPCHAGGLFGVITSNGKIYPCEILEHKLLGDLRENNMDFMIIWRNKITTDTKKNIIKDKCNCTYECALTIIFLKLEISSKFVIIFF